MSTSRQHDTKPSSGAWWLSPGDLYEQTLYTKGVRASSTASDVDWVFMGALRAMVGNLILLGLFVAVHRAPRLGTQSTGSAIMATMLVKLPAICVMAMVTCGTVHAAYRELILLGLTCSTYRVLVSSMNVRHAGALSLAVVALWMQCTCFTTHCLHHA